MKTVVLRNFAKFTEKHLCQTLLFNKVAGLRPATLLKRKFFAKFERTPFLISLNDFMFIRQHSHFHRQFLTQLRTWKLLNVCYDTSTGKNVISKCIRYENCNYLNPHPSSDTATSALSHCSHSMEL